MFLVRWMIISNPIPQSRVETMLKVIIFHVFNNNPFFISTYKFIPTIAMILLPQFVSFIFVFHITSIASFSSPVLYQNPSCEYSAVLSTSCQCPSLALYNFNKLNQQPSLILQARVSNAALCAMSTLQT